MKSRLKNGYSTILANFYINGKEDVISLSPELEPQYKWEDKGTTRQPTNEIVGYRAWFSIKGEQPFQVKFLSKVSLPPYLSKVKLEGLEACEVHHKVYFRASDIKEVQK